MSVTHSHKPGLFTRVTEIFIIIIFCILSGGFLGIWKVCLRNHLSESRVGKLSQKKMFFSTSPSHQIGIKRGSSWESSFTIKIRKVFRKHSKMFFSLLLIITKIRIKGSSHIKQSYHKNQFPITALHL